LLLLVGPPTARGALVSEAEAVAVANAWYAMELNSGHVLLTAEERSNRLALLPARGVSYLASADTVLDVPPRGRTVLAYIVKYKPHGLVVVPGDDRLNAVLVFSLEDDFRWDQPERNFLRYYLATEVPARWQHSAPSVHQNWTYIRAKLGEPLDKVRFETDTEYPVLWNTAHWNQSPYYNDTVIARNGNTLGIPAGCTATGHAIKMRFHQWPVTGSGTHSYTDNQGAVQYSHSVDYSTQTYNWSGMPTNDLTGPNAAIAQFMYHCGVSDNMDYEVGWSGAYTAALANALVTHFGYKGVLYLSSGHEDPIKSSVLARSPVNVSNVPHSMVIDGYREPTTPYYHVNVGWGGSSDNWYDLSSLPGGGGMPIRYSCPYAIPSNWFYVDGQWSGIEAGLIQEPFNTLSEGQNAVPAGGWLLMKEGLYDYPFRFAGAKTIVSYNAGTATINHRLRESKRGLIRISGNGVLRVD
jgi:hypothetical protein